MNNNWGSSSINFNVSNLDIEFLKKEVGQRFPFYDMKTNINTVVFFIRFDEKSLEEKFNSLRKALSEKDYIPMLRYDKGEHIIYIIQKSKRKEKPIWINIALLFATIITTVLTGSILYAGFFDMWSMPDITEVFAVENLLNGTMLFAFPLMSILFVHEMGHYYISKKHGITTSLPFFLPIPPIVPGFNIGTFGALISSRDPMPDKKALFDVGISGPIAGFCIAIPVIIIGLFSSNLIYLTDISSGQVFFGDSLLTASLSSIIFNVPFISIINKSVEIDFNLTFFAGWVGLLITSINLLPAGQLDGGHIFRAVFGEKQKYIGWIVVFLMVFTGWFLFAMIIVFMLGTSHPPPLNDDTKLDTQRKLLFPIALIILIICYIPYPIYIV